MAHALDGVAQALCGRRVVGGDGWWGAVHHMRPRDIILGVVKAFVVPGMTRIV